MGALYKQTIRSIGNGQAGRDANSIKNRILSDFYHHGNGSIVHHPYYDEPTYLSFRIAFTFENPSTNASLNDMPMPLFESYGIPDEKLVQTTASINELAGFAKNAASSIINPPAEINLRYNNRYSTYTYLINQKEPIRAEYLKQFINKLKDIEINYPFYFKSIEGINNLLKINTSSGKRLKEGENILTIKCLEGLDFKITELINLYRKIAWDDTYQRWVLPDMMRFFQMKIYISEIRNFHDLAGSNGKNGNSDLIESSLGKYGSKDTWGEQILDDLKSTSIVNKAVGMWNKVKSAVDSFKGINNSAWELFNDEINDYMPTLCITCNQCEFVIDDMFSNFATFTSNNKTALDDLTLKIKVGNITESQYYPLDGYEYRDLNKHLSIFDEELRRPSRMNWSAKKAELMDLYGLTSKRNYFNGQDAPFSNAPDRYTVYDGEVKDKLTDKLLNSVVGDVVNNAIDSVIGFLDQKAMNLANRGLNTKIGNTDLTVQGMINSLESKNILSMFRYIRDSINNEVNTSDKIVNIDDLKNSILENSLNNIQEPKIIKPNIKVSQKTNHSLQGDELFKDLMKEIGNLPVSEATSEQKLVIEIAKEIGDSGMNTKELDDFFYELKNISDKEIEKSIEDPKDKMIDIPSVKKSIKDFKDDIEEGEKRIDIYFKPEVNVNNLLDVSTLINSEFSGLIKNMRQLSLSAATDDENKATALKLYNILKKYINYNDLEGSVKKKIGDIINRDEILKEDKKTLIEFYELATTEKDLSELIKIMKELKKSVNPSQIPDSEAIENTYTPTKVFNIEKPSNLPDSEAIENTYIPTEVFDIEEPIVNKSNVDFHEFDDIKKKYKTLPDSEAVENLTYTNDIFKVVDNTIKKHNDIGSYKDQKDELKNLPDSEAIENLYYTNDLLKVEIPEKIKSNKIDGFNDLKNLEFDKSNEIDGFEDVKNLNFDKSNEIDGFEDIKNLNFDKSNKIDGFEDAKNLDFNKSTDIDGFEDAKNLDFNKSDEIDGFNDLKNLEFNKSDKISLSKINYNLPDSEATENWFDDMNLNKRNNIKSEYNKLKN